MTEDPLKETKAMIDAILNIRIAMKQYVQRRIREDKLDLTYEMVQVLAVLWRKGEINQQEIADHVQKNKASLTSLLDNLAKRNLIIRNEHPADRRNKIISLTESGKEYEKQLKPLLNDFYQVLTRNLPRQEMKKITGQLKNMEANLLI
ncbi:MarR family winged helix-turn-helix transcriptional regulator [Dyadobacter sp. 3J3]|uniref:MarR family winged helix-turn-helix transcriptional regulator n=1 Tax=Dyadobacter sp. 3J3 TaxID=2606600 RepID=UPI0013586FF8|nr:MarR family transcriptional regulator [Dyadobacter sp. 3J3]